jgi:hypothetical protein
MREVREGALDIVLQDRMHALDCVEEILRGRRDALLAECHPR